MYLLNIHCKHSFQDYMKLQKMLVFIGQAIAEVYTSPEQSHSDLYQWQLFFSRQWCRVRLLPEEVFFPFVLVVLFCFVFCFCFVCLFVCFLYQILPIGWFQFIYIASPHHSHARFCDKRTSSNIRVSRYSFWETRSMFFNHLKSNFILVR